MLPRIVDVADEHLRMMNAIEGYQNVRLMSLEDAVQPIAKFFTEKKLEATVWMLKERCKKPTDGLSVDESASIMLYTCQWNNTEESLYHILNRTLRMESRASLKPWFPYLRLLIGALIKLPAVNETLFRGIKGETNYNYEEGTEVAWWGFSSCTTCLNILESDVFCGPTGGPRIMFQVKCFSGRHIKNHSYFSMENEVLLLPGRYLQVVDSFTNGDGLRIIRLEEIQPPYSLLVLPDNSPWRQIQIGISLMGKCTTERCPAYQKEVIMPLGFRKFDVLSDSSTTTTHCPICKQYVDTSKLGFTECQWQLEALKQDDHTKPPELISETWKCTSGYSLYEYNLNNCTWRRLIVEAIPKSNV